MKICLSKTELEVAIRARYPVPAGFAIEKCEINQYRDGNHFLEVELVEIATKPSAVEAFPETAIRQRVDFVDDERKKPNAA